jgi:sarcosine oxidase subunit beta
MPKKQLPAEVDVVICGAGIIGAAIAYFLTKETSYRVLCLEKEHKGSGSTQRSAAAFRQQFSSRVNVEFSLYSRYFYENFSKNFGLAEEVFHKNGYLFLYQQADLWESALQRMTLQRSLGVKDVESLTGSSLFHRFPQLRQDPDFPLCGATFCPTDGFLDPVLVCSSFLEKAKTAGLQLFEYTKLDQIETQQKRVCAVEVDGQRVKTPIVMNASGVWSNELCRSLGFAVPIVPVKRYLYTTNQFEQNVQNYPMIVCNLGVYTRPEIRGLMIGGDEKPAKPPGWNTFNPHPEPFTASYEMEEGFGAKNIEGYGYHLLFELAQYLPFLETEATLEAVTCGYYQVSPDEKAILGEDPRLAGLYHAIGFSGHGVMHAPAVGQQMAQVLAGKPTTIDWRESLSLAPLLQHQKRADPEKMVI